MPHGAWTEDTFKSQVLPLLKMHLPIALDRMDLHKRLMNQLECQHNFTLDSIEQIWNLYKDKILTGFEGQLT